MAYNTRFFFRFESYAGREFRINIKQDGYTGSAVQRPLGASPTLRRDDADNGIRGTSLEIIAECATDNEFATLYTSDARKFYVELVDVSTSAVIWDGFVSPELYAAPEIAPPYDVQITAVDGLGELKRQKFPAGGRKTILAHLQTILGYAGLSAGTSDIIIIDSLHCTTPSAAAAGLLGSITVDLDHLVAEDMNCYDALEAILRTLNLTITRISSKRWLIMRESDVEVQSSAVAAMTAAGSSVSLPVPQYGSMTVSDWWPVGNMANEIEPAKKQLSTALAYAMRDSMLNDGDMEDSSAWTTQLVRFDNGWAKMNGDAINRLPAILSQSINVSQHGGPLQLSIASLHAVARIFPSDSDVKASVEVKLQASGETQYLQKSAGDCLSWTTREKDFSFVTPLSVASSPLWPDRGGVTETTWVIPEIPAAGVLTVTIKLGYSGSQDYSLWIDHIHLLQTAPYGYMDTVVLDNDARGKLDEFIHVFGDSPYTPNALANIRNIVSTSGGTVVEEWATAQFEGELLSVMAMDRALAAALPRLWAKGTIHVPTSAVLPFAMVSPDDLPMIIKRASWKLLEDEIDLDLLSIPAAEVEIDSETITEMTGSEAAASGGSGSSSGGGSGGSSGGGSGSIYNYFEDVEVEGERVGIKSIYDLFIIQTPGDEEGGTPEEKKNISSILRHFSERIIDEGEETERTVLICDISLGSELAVFAGGIADSGGGGGGGSLATLADVSLTNLANGQIIRYNALTSHWENATITLALSALSDVNLGTPTDGQVLKYNSSSQKWIAANDACGIASVALAGGTNNGTLKLTVDGSVTDNIAVTGLAALAYKSSLAFSDLTSHPSTISGYGITDAKIANGTITLGANTITPLTSVPEAANNAYGGFKTGYSESGKYYAVQLSSGKAYVYVPWTDTVYTHPTGGANTTITAANGKVLSAITVDSYGHTTSVSSKTLSANDIPDLSGSYLPLSGGTLTGDLRLQTGGSAYGSRLRFGDGNYAYIEEDTDDHLSIYGNKGLTLLTSSSSYGLVVGSSSIATPTTLYGTLAVSGNTTISGTLAIGSTSSNKSVTIYGSTSAALTIHGGSSYSTNIYRNSSALQVSSNVAVTGNLTATGAITAGAASDHRLKENINTISLEDADFLLSHARPVEFDWNEEAGRLGGLHGHSRGFIASEYLALLPGAGRKIWEEYDAIDYNQIIPYLVAGWQQQNLRIRILEGEIKTLKEDLQRYRREMR